MISQYIEIGITRVVRMSKLLSNFVDCKVLKKRRYYRVSLLVGLRRKRI